MIETAGIGGFRDTRFRGRRHQQVSRLVQATQASEIVKADALMFLEAPVEMMTSHPEISSQSIEVKLMGQSGTDVSPDFCRKFGDTPVGMGRSHTLETGSIEKAQEDIHQILLRFGPGGEIATAEDRIDHTQPMVFSADETADVGIDLATPVVEAIGSEAESRFTGRIPRVTIEVQAAGPSAGSS